MAKKECIEREAAKKILADDYAYAAAKLLDTVPTADVQEVVRCKDCKWLNKTKMICMNKNNRVFNTGKTVYSNNFCNYGAKMDKE